MYEKPVRKVWVKAMKDGCFAIKIDFADGTDHRNVAGNYAVLMSILIALKFADE